MTSLNFSTSARCESTNKQPSLDAYLHRAAILGQDLRGGAMALLFATEMAGLGK